MNKAVLIILITVLILALGAAGVWLYLDQRLQAMNDIETIERPTEKPIVIENFVTPVVDTSMITPTPEITPEPSEAPIWALDSIDSNVINLLLAGVDTRDASTDLVEENADSDSMMLVSCNLKTKRVVIFSLMRDGGVYVQNTGWYDKINKAYANGGIGGLINCINGAKNFDLDVQNYISINFNMFIHIIDAVGGLDIDLSEEECKFINDKIDLENGKATSYMPRQTGHVEVREGVQHLNGEQALWYARDRYSEGLGDWGRTSRQRHVLTLLYQKVRDGWTIEMLGDIFDYVCENAKTNLTVSQLAQLATIAMSENFQIDTTTIPFPGMGRNGVNKKGNYLLEYDMDKHRDLIHGIIYDGDPIPEGTIDPKTINKEK